MQEQLTIGAPGHRELPDEASWREQLAQGSLLYLHMHTHKELFSLAMH